MLPSLRCATLLSEGKAVKAMANDGGTREFSQARPTLRLWSKECLQKYNSAALPKQWWGFDQKADRTLP